MDDASMNHYEKQLYTVFKTFDVDNEEALDRSAVHELCDALQLEDRGAALVNTLFERRSDRVTFAQFRNGLLAVLGGGGSDPARAASAPPEPPPQPDPPPHHSDDDSSGREVAPKFVFGSKKYGRRSRPPRSGVAGDEPLSPRSSSASRLDTDDKRARQRMRCRRSASAMESRDDNTALDDVQDNIQVDTASTETFEHDRRIDREEALALCRGLNMDGIDRRLVERIFDDTGTADTTVGEFFDRLNASLSTTMEEATREVRASSTTGDAGADATDDEAVAGLPSELVLEAWERAGVQQPRRLLAELGFTAAARRPPELERALDDELRTLAEPPDQSRDARALLLAAALALSRLRLERARRRADLTAAERDKLRGDVAEASRHARLLAQEVDESHARIEAELKASLRRAEARHAEATRQVATENAAERERAAVARARLEAEVARRAEAEARLRAELAALAERADELEARAAAAEERGAAAERECARLGAELRAALERGAAAAQCAEPQALQARLDALRRDNQLLRDRNDELCAALEARQAAGGGGEARGGDLCTELDELLTHERSEECDSSPVSIDQRTLGHVEVVTRLGEILESIRAIPRVADSDSGACAACAAAADSGACAACAAAADSGACAACAAAADSGACAAAADSGACAACAAAADSGACAACAAAADQLRRVQRALEELADALQCAEPPPAAPGPASGPAPGPAPAGAAADCAAQTDALTDADQLRQQLLDAERKHDDEKQKLTGLVKDLESSLGQMKAEYDKCEEYWSGKLEEERDMFGEEQRLGDERLAELVAKIHEYERQFAPALPTIDERHSLEAQFTDLEEEFAAYRRDKDAELRDKEAQLREKEAELRDKEAEMRARAADAARLGERVRVLERRAAEPSAARQAAEVRELRARTQRAEAAARRLLARLAAADLLVKDLYVENCQLAHRRPT